MDPSRLRGSPAQDPPRQKVQHRHRPTHPAEHRRRSSGPNPMAKTNMTVSFHEMIMGNGSPPPRSAPQATKNTPTPWKQPGNTIPPERRRNDPRQPPRTPARSNLKRSIEEPGPRRARTASTPPKRRRYPPHESECSHQPSAHPNTKHTELHVNLIPRTLFPRKQHNHQHHTKTATKPPARRCGSRTDETRTRH
jgi:hypothetical protein